jgi:23S rRNA (pseudouridine1915-N3)-methyltransferase
VTGVWSAGDRSAASIVFCIGGPYGHTDEVRARADRVVSLSNCILNHQVARVVLLEQIYRAWAIIRREPYHH